MLLPTLFPDRKRPRTVVHAGPLLLERPGGVGALRRFLRVPRRREVLLVHYDHHDGGSLRSAARDAGVVDIALGSPPPDEVHEEALGVVEMALALGARCLDFTIGEPGVRGRGRGPLEEISLSEAESMERDPRVPARIRAKLGAGCEAMRHGVARVRIGDPVALTADRATRLVRDPGAAADGDAIPGRPDRLTPAIPGAARTRAVLTGRDS